MKPLILSALLWSPGDCPWSNGWGGLAEPERCEIARPVNPCYGRGPMAP